MKLSFSKITFKSICSLLLACVLVVVIVFGVPSIKLSTASVRYKGVIELWNVEDFEGGSGSRGAFVTKCSSIFEKQNAGLFVHVTTLTHSQALQKLTDGESFDIVLFSIGFGCEVAKYLHMYQGSVGNISSNLLDAGELDGKVYALPVWKGGYGLFARTSELNGKDLTENCLNLAQGKKVGKNVVELQSLVVGRSAYCSPLTALCKLGVKGKSFSVSTQYSAYESFLSGIKSVALIGSQRDVVRLGNKLQNNKIAELSFAPLSTYNDLVQFAGLNNKLDGTKLTYVTKYLEYLTSSEVQNKLSSISLFSVLDDVLLYSSGWMGEMEKSTKDAYTPNVFMGKNEIKIMQQNAENELKNE